MSGPAATDEDRRALDDAIREAIAAGVPQSQVDAEIELAMPFDDVFAYFAASGRLRYRAREWRGRAARITKPARK